ncbi:MAG: hypothetical protein Hens2KO_19710 [Henriciella sp.]
MLAVDASIAPRASALIESLSGKKLEKGSALKALNGKEKAEAVADVMIGSCKIYLTEYTRNFRVRNKYLCAAQFYHFGKVWRQILTKMPCAFTCS